MVEQLDLFPKSDVSRFPVEPRKRGCQPLENIAPLIRIGDRVTQGWKEGCLALYPQTDWAYSSWLLVHIPTGQKVLASFSRDDLRLARAVLRIASAWDWRGSEPHLIPVYTRRKWLQLQEEFELRGMWDL